MTRNHARFLLRAIGYIGVSVLVGCMAVAILTACGGGEEQADPMEPQIPAARVTGQQHSNEI